VGEDGYFEQKETEETKGLTHLCFRWIQPLHVLAEELRMDGWNILRFLRLLL
jgi:hypothetical protein